MEQFGFVWFSVVTVEVCVLLGCDPGTLGDPYAIFRGILEAWNIKCTPRFLNKVDLLLCLLRCKCTRSLIESRVCCLVFQDCSQTRVPSSLNSCCPAWWLQQRETGHVALLFSILKTWPHHLKPFSLGAVCTCVWDCTDDCHRLRISEKKITEFLNTSQEGTYHGWWKYQLIWTGLEYDRMR